ncbi:Glutathione S-transferase domain protein [[Leptolyngbya] sp. PCC 7376]|uniref:glutathione S-transferase family protein n=1 Tax=[Leptolyngbya] sp. PCC 7376 TaxID=111781 RepID=UPI00029F46D5|nr:glutathione S-transferase family protein [[Leptolyngbya] sp. PCC 7376]AFY38543.1 Glutathione S-transferase domain protein [[Leptolyngbya] sp. PCC 7376]
MLTFHYHPLSPISLRVWLALLEKDVPFREEIVDIPNGAQRRSPFTDLNPFHHVPVITDGDFRLVESFAILDYLELKYPENSLMPSTSEAIATMKMLQMVTANELFPLLPKLIAAIDSPLPAQAQDRLDKVLTFFEQHLNGQLYFGGDRLNLADIVVGAAIPLMCRLGLELTDYPELKAWGDRLTSRPAWQKTRASDEELAAWRAWLARYLRVAAKAKQREQRQTSSVS